MIISKNLLGALLAAVGLFGFWAFAAPAYRNISAVRAAIADHKNILNERQRVLDDIAGLTQEYDQRADDVLGLSRVIPAKKDTPELISAVDNIALRSGLRLATLKVGEPKKDSAAPYSIIPVEMSMSGSYSALLDFLYNLERNARIVDVTSLSAQPKESEGNILNVTLRGNTYSISK